MMLSVIQHASSHGGAPPESLYPPATTPAEPGSVPPREYVYLRPRSLKGPPDRMVVHEAFGEWGDGVVVGFLDGHVEFIGDRSRFESLLAAARGPATKP